MRRSTWIRLLAFVGVTAFAANVWADDRVAYLAERLRSDDFKIRYRAVTALGQTNDEGAVQPLCGALSDTEYVVRQASAAALKQLGRSSALGCLKSRLATEQVDTVKL